MSSDFMPYCTNNTFITIKQYHNTSFEKYSYYRKHFTSASRNTVKQLKLKATNT